MSGAIRCAQCSNLLKWEDATSRLLVRGETLEAWREATEDEMQAASPIFELVCAKCASGVA